MPEAVFVGGGTGGGKTTLARSLAARHGLRLLQIDSFWYAHAERSGEAAPPPDVQRLEWSPARRCPPRPRPPVRLVLFPSSGPEEARDGNRTPEGDLQAGNRASEPRRRRDDRARARRGDA